jgi:UDP-glucuronate 4-epimerase
MNILVTGGAGFIGAHVCKALLSRGDSVICIDDFNDYYDPKLKESRVKEFSENFKLYRADIRDFDVLKKIFSAHKIDKVAHLAARAGVRASLQNPFIYEEVNVKGTLNLLELSKDVKNFVFASSSSVYGGNKKIPFSESDPVDNQISPYGATKKAGEVLCHCYNYLYNIPISCLRFFTVYGPSGRPDMALFKFTKAISEGKTIDVYGNGKMKRDFTYVDDVVAGILAALDNNYPFEIFNLGNSNTVELMYFISLIEGELGKKAKINFLPMQPGDVPVTYADISKAKKMLGFVPKTKIEKGVRLFIDWYKDYYK